MTKTGAPEVPQAADALPPAPFTGEVLVCTHAPGLNVIDIYQRTGSYPVRLPLTPGAEASGVVETLGEGVTTLQVGDGVWTARATRTYAQLFTVPADRAVVVPASIELDIAAALPLHGLAAHYLVTSTAHPKPVQAVLAQPGGVGSVAHPGARRPRVRAVTTTSDDE